MVELWSYGGRDVVSCGVREVGVCVFVVLWSCGVVELWC